MEAEVTSATNWLPILHLGIASTNIEGIAVRRMDATPSHYEAECK